MQPRRRAAIRCSWPCSRYLSSPYSPQLPSRLLPPAIVMLGVVALVLIASGFYMIQPNQAAAITLFGSYRGTDRAHRSALGLAVDGQDKISVRANNFISEKIKVNDLRGNPIEMAAQVVWRVVDTAQALYDVDDYRAFVMVQIEAAVRTIGSRYPYDDFAHQEVTLRGNATGQSRTTDRADHRLQMAGIYRRRMRFHPPGLRRRDRRRHAAPPAGASRRRGPQDPGRGRGRHGAKWRSTCCRKRASSTSTASAARRWSRT